ncbi:hypothetical protein NFX46_11310 [Streptomyces phaeoluteigriseus]|uniref:Gram-positive cocci surface proteins LPxTG domain-containing protein n=1 Tax=Streptomyces phaeoluteigriseus TaxID=114686 RepID=A0ABY4Z5S2_9ACTN|nr:hypothetical protein [Streptomyces phaeoluteigriseus]USQ84331.1 hypothetical protein NFX46_11310 [Streptomyces phaeoluteigriseus]
MRRTARVLSVAALAGAVLSGVAPAASADPAAEISPATAAPGGGVTVTVTCDPLGAPAPRTIEAASDAFEDGTVELTLEPGGDELTGPAYRGTARIAPAADLDVPADAVGTDSAWTVDGTCPAPPGGEGGPWSATYDVPRAGGAGPSAPSASSAPDVPSAPDCAPTHATACATPQPCPPGHTASCPTHPAPQPCPTSRATAPHGTAPHGTGCPGAAVQHGVRAGTGGTFTDSVPALVAGGLLIAGAVGAAVHRLRRRDRTAGL